MDREQIHRAFSRDGTQIVAHVQGDGQPLVLVSGSGDGQNHPFLLPELSEHFTCYSLSLRSQGLSDANPDHAPERLVQDIVAVVDSVGSAVAQTEAVHAVALYEPHVIELYGPEDVARADGALERMQAATSQGDPAEAAKVFFEEITLPNPRDLAALSESGAFDSIAPIMPVIVSEIPNTHRLNLTILDTRSAPVLDAASVGGGMRDGSGTPRRWSTARTFAGPGARRARRGPPGVWRADGTPEPTRRRSRGPRILDDKGSALTTPAAPQFRHHAAWRTHARRCRRRSSSPQRRCRESVVGPRGCSG